MSTGPQYIEPNLYQLSGQDISIQYSSTSVAGVPLFSYQYRGAKKSFRADQISMTATELGTLVSVVVDAVPDLHTTTLTLVLPAVNLDGSDDSGITIQTFAVFTTGLTSIGGPRFVKGQLTRYDEIPLTGRAQCAEY